MEGERADDRVVEVLAAMRMPIHVLVGPPTSEVLVRDREFADEFGQQRIVGMASGVPPERGDDVLGVGVPVGIQRAGGVVAEHEPDQVPLAGAAARRSRWSSARAIGLDARTSSRRPSTSAGVCSRIRSRSRSPGRTGCGRVAVRRGLPAAGLASWNRWARSTGSRAQRAGDGVQHGLGDVQPASAFQAYVVVDAHARQLRDLFAAQSWHSPRAAVVGAGPPGAG